MDDALYGRQLELGMAYAQRHLLPLLPALREYQAEGVGRVEWAIPPVDAAEAEIEPGALFYGVPIVVDGDREKACVRLVVPWPEAFELSTGLRERCGLS